MAKSISKDSKADPKTQGQAAPEAEAEAPAAPKKRGWLKIVLLLVPLLGAAGGGAWYFLHGSEPAEKGKAGVAKTAHAKPPVFVTLEPFTVNLQHDDASPQYLQVGLTLKVGDEPAAETIKLHMPEIRNRVLLLLSGKSAADISSVKGKESLSADLAREIGKSVAGAEHAAAIDGVLFTSFVVQ